MREHFHTRASVEIIERIEVGEIWKIGPQTKVGKEIEVVVRIRISQAWVTVVLCIGIVDFPSNGSHYGGTSATKGSWMSVRPALCEVLPEHVVETGHDLGIDSGPTTTTTTSSAAAGIGFLA